MIKVDRQHIAKPKFFESEEYKNLLKEISDFYGLHANTRAQRTYDVGYMSGTIIDELATLFNRKCAFCESTLRAQKPGFESYLHRFRPDSYSQGVESTEVSRDHYWWLTYEWENLYMCCHSCSRFKSNKFPVDGKRAAIKTPHSEIHKKEKALLIDPCLDNPSIYFRFDLKEAKILVDFNKINSYFRRILPNGSDEHVNEIVIEKSKAEATINIFELNRTDLINERREVLEQLSKQYNLLISYSNNTPAIINEWKEILEEKSTLNHILFRKTAILDFLNQKEARDKLGSYLQVFEQLRAPKGNESNALENIQGSIGYEQQADIERPRSTAFPDDFSGGSPPPPPKPKTPTKKETPKSAIFDGILKNVYLDRIVLKNFKCFSELELKLPDYSGDTSSEPWLVFLGENGVGKSSVLKAIALALMGQDYLDTLNLKVSSLLKYGKQKGFIRVYGKGNEEFYEITFEKKSNQIISNIQHPCAFLIGYGSTRLMPIGNLQPEQNHPDYIKVKNLFDASISLSDAKKWFLNADRKTFNEVSRSIKNLLLLNDKDAIGRSVSKEQISIKYFHTGETVDIDHLSDGYKSVFAIAIDMIYTLSKKNSVYALAEGIVLVDEIGTHLHPRWKMEIIKRLRTTFPKIQFIITTHEPLCLRGIKGNEVVVLRKNDENTIDAISDLPDPSSLRIDQLLTSEYFGLNSTMDIETEKLFKEYYKLLGINEAERNSTQKARLKTLEKEVQALNYMRFGNDKREEIVYQVVDELMAKDMRKKQLKIETSDMKQEAIDTVKNLWESLD